MDKILFIDDDDNILNFASKMLCYLGYEVKVAHDGEEGIELLKKNCRFKAVITDIRMPRKNGNQVAKYIRDAKKISGTPIFAITGFPEDAENGLFDSVLTKPFKMKEVISLIHTL
ncbi:MAG: response regulator [Deltaproteobacteria bacterium]|nr:response regulator [Deltaproteobacteria bacterium]